MKLKTEGESHLLAVGLDVNEVANLAKGGSDVLDGVLHVAGIGGAELPDGMIGVGVDHDRQLHLAFEVVDKRSLLGFDKGVLIAGDVLDLEAMLLKNLLAFCRVTNVIEAKVDATSVDRNTGVEASILDHEFVLGIKTGVGAIRKLEDDHVARDEVVAVELIDKASWHIRLRLRKLLRLLEDDAQAGLAAMTNDGSDAVVAAVLGVTSHVSD
ncbi:hypothetical protein HBI17_166530 [Parastagonospora nodorum]|nr:hypothetical protein HBI45_193980 [Parastagonospora nodorum]KAH5741764.1 hypothetical protein HBI17_166530 [Parastagonospora nodorum]